MSACRTEITYYSDPGNTTPIEAAASVNGTAWIVINALSRSEGPTVAYFFKDRAHILTLIDQLEQAAQKLIDAQSDRHFPLDRIVYSRGTV